MNTVRFPFFIVCVLLLSLSTVTAQAASSDARVALENTINEVLVELKDPALRSPAGKGKVLARIEAIIDRMFDFAELSARTVGPSWKEFTPEQKNKFEEAFATLLRETYLEKFDTYDGEAVQYLGEVTSSNGNRVEIQTKLDFKDSPASVNYRMLKKSKWAVYDVVIEGVSLVQNFRSQFQTILAKNDFNQLIALVEKKSIEAKEHNEQQRAK